MKEAIQWKAVRKTTTLELLGKVELRCGIEYPELYVRTVWENNAGIPDRANFRVPGLGECDFGRLISVREEDRPNIFGASDWLNDDEEETEICRIPFAMDPFGNLLCFRWCSGVCAVVYRDHETGREYYLTDTFEEFLDRLCR